MFQLRSNLIIIETILLAQPIERVRLPNALIKRNENTEFFITIVNQNAIPKIVTLKNIALGPFQNSTVNCLNEEFCDKLIDRNEIIKNNLPSYRLNDEEL